MRSDARELRSSHEMSFRASAQIGQPIGRTRTPPLISPWRHRHATHGRLVCSNAWVEMLHSLLVVAHARHTHSASAQATKDRVARQVKKK